jgi:hypothetical protein
LTILQVTTNRLHYSSTPSTQTNLLQARRMGSRMGAQCRNNRPQQVQTDVHGIAYNLHYRSGRKLI